MLTDKDTATAPDPQLFTGLNWMALLQGGSLAKWFARHEVHSSGGLLTRRFAHQEVRSSGGALTRRCALREVRLLKGVSPPRRL